VAVPVLGSIDLAVSILIKVSIITEVEEIHRELVERTYDLITLSLKIIVRRMI